MKRFHLTGRIEEVLSGSNNDPVGFCLNTFYVEACRRGHSKAFALPDGKVVDTGMGPQDLSCRVRYLTLSTYPRAMLFNKQSMSGIGDEA